VPLLVCFALSAGPGASFEREGSPRRRLTRRARLNRTGRHSPRAAARASASRRPRGSSSAVTDGGCPSPPSCSRSVLCRWRIDVERVGGNAASSRRSGFAERQPRWMAATVLAEHRRAAGQAGRRRRQQLPTTSSVSPAGSWNPRAGQRQREVGVRVDVDEPARRPGARVDHRREGRRSGARSPRTRRRSRSRRLTARRPRASSRGRRGQQVVHGRLRQGVLGCNIRRDGTPPSERRRNSGLPS